jgi:hypothetical protein
LKGFRLVGYDQHSAQPITINDFYQIPKSRRWGIKPIANFWRLLLNYLTFLLSALFLLHPVHGSSAEIIIRKAGPSPQERPATKRPDQLPQSRVAHGYRNITAAWLADPTDRYRHGVLGDELEAGRLVVETRSGKRLQIDLPLTHVFEDLEPRLADIDGDNRDEIIVVESDTALGASLAVYGIVNERLVLIAATPFLGQPNRWLNPLGVSDFDGDGKPDIALVATPHIGGILRLYRFSRPDLSLFAEYTGVSTHRIGSTELGLGRVVPATPRNQLLVPDQARRVLMLLEWLPNEWRVVARAALPGSLASSLMSSGERHWRFRLEDGRSFEIQLDR